MLQSNKEFNDFLDWVSSPQQDCIVEEDGLFKQDTRSKLSMRCLQPIYQEVRGPASNGDSENALESIESLLHSYERFVGYFQFELPLAKFGRLREQQHAATGKILRVSIN